MSRREQARPHVERALQLESDGHLSQAIEALHQALDLDPTYAEAATLLARCHESRGEWSRAVEAWQHAYSLDPDTVDTALGLAESLRQARCHYAALDLYERVLLDRPDSVFALAGKAETLRMLGRPNAALQCFDLALSHRPDHAFALRGQAATLNTLGRFAEALPVWVKALSIDPSSRFAVAGREESRRGLDRVSREPHEPVHDLPEPTDRRRDAYRQLEWGRALVTDDRHNEAIGALAQAHDLDPTWPEPLTELVDCHTEIGDHQAAVHAADDLVDLSPDQPEPLTVLADTYRRANQLDEAAATYRRALALDADHLGALSGLGETHRIAGRVTDALTHFNRALRIDPAEPFALCGQAACLAALGHHDQAVQIWHLALEADPDSDFAKSGLAASEAALNAGPLIDRAARARARVHFDMGRAWLQQDRINDAIRAFENAIREDPHWEEPHFLLGITHEHNRQPRRAVSAFEACLARRPDHFEALVRKAQCLQQQGDLAAALGAYKQAGSISIDDLRVQLGMGDCLRLTGRYLESLAPYQAVLDSRPRDFAALCGKAASLSALDRHDQALPLWLAARDENSNSNVVRRGLAKCRANLVTRPGAEPDSRHRAREALEMARALHKARNVAAALGAARRALEIDPTFAEAALRVGMLLEESLRYRDAILAYERCLALDPTCFQAATNIGEAHRKSENYLDSLAAYDRALVLRPDYLYAIAGRGESMRMLGQYSECIAWFNRALAQEPRHIFAIQGKAAALNSLLRFTEALPLWRRALEIDPSSGFAKDGLRVCEAQLGRENPEGVAYDESVSGTPTLDEQGRDLTALARAGQLGDVIGREREIRSVMKTLVRRQKANPILLGDPGVGKTAVVEGLAQALTADDAPSRLRGLRIIEISMGSLVAGTKYRGTFEDRIKALVREAGENPGTVLFIDEIHTLVGAGRTEGGSLDAANILKPALARGELTVIGATTVAEYRKYIESDPALERRFQPVMIDEPTPDDAVELLRGVVQRYADHHEVEVEDGALHACVALSARYITDRRLPDKALDLLDEACADASLEGVPVVTSTLVAKVLSERTGIPVHQLTAAERARLTRLEQVLSDRIKGQPTAIDRLAVAVRLCRSGLRDPARPRGVFLFAGPSGVGKTELARQLAGALFPEGNAFVRLDMSEYTDKFTTSRLIGAPPGYAGHGEPGQLTEKLRRRPYAVVLLDEFEKAHPEVQTLFLSLFDEGHITDSEGREVSAHQALFILTSNVGSESTSRAALGFGGRDSQAAADRLVAKVREHFRPELINRLDDIVPFAPLDEPELREIATYHLERLAQRALDEGVSLSWTPEVLDHLVRADRNPAYGARPVLRAIDRLVAGPLGDAILGATAKTPPLVAVLDDGRIVLRAAADPPPEPTALEPA